MWIATVRFEPTPGEAATGSCGVKPGAHPDCMAGDPEPTHLVGFVGAPEAGLARPMGPIPVQWNPVHLAATTLFCNVRRKARDVTFHRVSCNYQEAARCARSLGRDDWDQGIPTGRVSC